MAIHRRGSQNAVWVAHDDAVLTLNSGDIARLVENIKVWELKGPTVRTSGCKGSVRVKDE